MLKTMSPGVSDRDPFYGRCRRNHLAERVGCISRNHHWIDVSVAPGAILVVGTNASSSPRDF